MNGQPIPLLHGGPLRLIVPTWFAMASTKWLTRIHARPTPSDNYFMQTGYRYGDGSPVEQKRVKSLITAPLAGDEVAAGPLTVTGTAWTGAGVIERVDLSDDGGRTWHPARLTTQAQPGGWVLWEGDVVNPTSGERTLRARATDSAGAVQPAAAAPNPGGYGNNSIQEVRYRVA